MDDSKRTREQRLAAALRANLHRRKQQARERAESERSQAPEDTGEAPDSAGGRGKT